MINSTIPQAAVSDASQFSPMQGWNEVPLYTNVCLDTVPVLIQHTGTVKEREADWPKLWIQAHGRRLVEEVLDRGNHQEGARGGAYTNGRYIPWENLCPAVYEAELYREYDDAL